MVHDSRRPFVVSARYARATDVGTDFGVRAYATDSSVQVAVTAGIVALSGGTASNPQLTLRAGDVGTVRGDSAPRAMHSGGAASYSAWIDGRLSFDNAPLSAVAAELSRWFDVDIRIDDPAIAQRRVTALYSDARLAGVLGALSAAMNLRYIQTGRAVTLRAAGGSQ